MLFVGLLVALLGSVRVVTAKAVFAHFMVENAKNWDTSQWETDINLARAAHIDGFALNFRADDASASAAMTKAFEVADAKGDFKMILSLDYAGGGAFSYGRAESFISKFSAYDSYFMVDGRPFVSTFEGPGSAGDWETIKADTDCFLVPDWSSLGAQAALAATDGVIDGLFAWSAWPWGNTDMNTYVDASYLQFMDTAGKSWGKNLTYMMPASPWFYTNLPGYDKNWMWHGDSLWFDRWQEIIFLNPDYVEIISWNDFGESHHIGPLYVEGDDYQAFTVGEAPFNYAQDMPHDGWRKFLPFVIDLYKNRKATINQEGISAWYRPSPKQSGCDDGGTTGNTASQLQEEFWPWDIVEDKIFFSALLASSQAVSVTVGGVAVSASWTFEPENGKGLYHGSAAYGGSRGAVVITVGSMSLAGREITDACNHVDGQNGQQNWNAWVGSVDGASVNTEVDISLWGCIEGSSPGAPEFADLCEFTCKYDYCPPGACYCSKMGDLIDKPESTGVVAYPAEGMSASYSGLCTFACNLGHCPSEYCDTQEHALVVPNVSPFTPDACIHGTGEGNLGGLCGYACNFGYCPIHSCTCDATGPLIVPPAQTSKTGYAADGLDPLLYDGLCDFACSRGYCPVGACVQEAEVSDENPVYLGTEIWSEPTAHCEPPCIFVLPPSALPATTTITIGPYVTSLQVGTTTTTITVTPPAITTGSIPFYNVNVTSSMTDGAQFVACTSMALDPLDVTLTYVTTGQTRITTRELSLPPYPQITQGPPESWTQTCDVWGGGGYWGTSSTPTFVPTDTSTTTTSTPTPTWTQFPPVYATDNDEDDDEDEDDDDDVIVVNCDGWWFFNFCVDFPEFKVSKWKIRIPPGEIGPGPPPPSMLHRDGWTIKFPGPLPPWPKIVVPPGPKPVVDVPEKPDDCNTVTQEILFETVSQGLSVSEGKTITTTESTITRTATMLGCSSVEGYTETISSCNIAKRTEPAPVANIAQPTSTSPPPVLVKSEADLESRQVLSIFDQDNPIQWENDLACPGGEGDYILYPKSHVYGDLDLIRQRLTASTGTNGFTFTEVGSTTTGYVAYYVVRQMPYSMASKMSQMTQVRYLYDYINFLTTGKTYYTFSTIGRREAADREALRNADNTTSQAKPKKRANKIRPFDLSQLSAPEGTNWLTDNNYVATSNGATSYNYFYDTTEGAGQTIFVVEDSFSDVNSHVEFSGMSVPGTIEVPTYGPTSNNDPWHGSLVVACAAGQVIGVAPRADVIPVALGGVFVGGQAFERIIHALLLIYDYISSNNLQGRAVINMSWGVKVEQMKAIKPFGEILLSVLQALQSDLGVVLVAASGNFALLGANGVADLFYPQKYLASGELPDLLVVGSVDRNARRWETSSHYTDQQMPMVYAWGHEITAPVANGGYDTSASGTSFAAPKVAGLVAYFRGLNPAYQSKLMDASLTVELVRKMTRKLSIDDPNVQSTDGAPDTLVWNGQIGNDNCLLNKVNGCPTWLSPSGIGNKAGSISYSSGSPSPTCTADCGVLCTGYYCEPKPTGTPPDYADPENPTTTKTTSSATPTATISGKNEMEILYVVEAETGRFSLWYWMNSIIEGEKQDFCALGQMVTIGASDDIDPDKPGLPPYDADDINSDGDWKGYGTCSYTHSDTGGTLKCPDVDVEVKCKTTTDAKFKCPDSTDGDGWYGLTMTPIVKCAL